MKYLILTVVLLASVTASAQDGADPKFMQDALSALQGQRERAMNEAASAEAQLAKAQRDLQTAQAKIAELQKELDALKAKK